MPFAVCAAADLYASKVNLEVSFPLMPTISELIAAIQSTFAYESQAIRPPGVPLQPFAVQKLQIFNDNDGSWRDLTSATQLSDYCQLYVFQVDPRYRESQDQIMPARRPTLPPSTGTPISPPTTLSPFGPASSDVPRYSGAASVGNGSNTLRHFSPPKTRSEAQPIFSGSPMTLLGRMSTATLGGGGSEVLAARPPPPEQSTFPEKVRYVFEEMDLNGNRLVEPDEFRAVLRALNIEFSTATVNDLFRKADQDRDGVLSIGEFTSFFQNYTTLLDSLFFRLRDVVASRQLQRELEEERSGLEAANERRQRAQATLADTARLLDQQAQKVALLEGERQQRGLRERELQAMYSQGEAELDRGRRETAERERDLVAARDREAQRKLAAQDASQAAQEAERLLHAHQAQLQAAQEKERQLQMLLVEAQRETERQQQIALATGADLSRMREREQIAAGQQSEAARALQLAQEALATAQREVLLRTERQHELSATFADQQADLARLTQRVKDESCDIQLCREREQSNRALCTEAEANVQLAERRLLAADSELVAFSKRRAEMEAKERPLVEQEVRLKEQRDSLNEKENRLRMDAEVVFDAGRGLSPSTGFSSALYGTSPIHR